MKVCIIGGGPGGLTNLKTLLHAPSHLGITFDPVLLEMGNRIGGQLNSLLLMFCVFFSVKLDPFI